MRILEYGNTNNPTIMLVHGFESPYQIWIDYIEHYKENYHILVPILPGHDVQEKSEFNSFDDTAKEIENYCISKSINHIYAIYGMSMGGVLASYLWKNKRLTFETVVLLSKGEIDSKKVRVEFSLEDVDMSGFQKGATYEQIKAYVLEKHGLKVSSLYISQVKRKCGLEIGQNYNLSKKEDAKVPQCPLEKEEVIIDALKHFQII